MDHSERKKLNLTVLQRHDPEVVDICYQSPHAVVYKFKPEDKKWEMMGFEGTLFLLQRRTAPYYALFILNRQSIDNFSLYLTEFSQIEITDEFITYLTSKDQICALWLFAEKDRQPMLDHIIRLRKTMAAPPQPAASPATAGKRVDIFQMLKQASVPRQPPNMYDMLQIQQQQHQQQQQQQQPPRQQESGSDIATDLFTMLKKGGAKITDHSQQQQQQQPAAPAPPTTDKGTDLLRILQSGTQSPQKAEQEQQQQQQHQAQQQPAARESANSSTHPLLNILLNASNGQQQPQQPQQQQQHPSPHPPPMPQPSLPSMPQQMPQPHPPPPPPQAMQASSLQQFPQAMPHPSHPPPMPRPPMMQSSSLGSSGSFAPPAASPQKVSLLQALQGGNATGSMNGTSSSQPPAAIPSPQTMPNSAMPNASPSMYPRGFYANTPPLAPQHAMDLAHTELEQRMGQMNLSKPQFIQQFLNMVQNDGAFMDSLYERYRASQPGNIPADSPAYGHPHQPQRWM